MTYAAKASQKSNYAASVLESIAKNTGQIFHTAFQPVCTFLQGGLPCSGNILELHFNRDDGWFDFACRINKQFDAPFLSRELSFPGMPPRIRQGYDQLITPPSGDFAFGIENVWFEYDLPVSAYPAVFFDLYRRQHFCYAETFDALRSVGQLFHYPVNNAILPFLQKVQANGLRTVYYGFMFSRNTQAVRMTIDGIGCSNLVSVLKTIGWDGNYQWIKEWQRKYQSNVSKIVLAIDHDKKLGNKLGIEVFSDEPSSLTTLIRAYISQKQYSFLQEWEGEIVPENSLKEKLTLLHNREITHICKRINHIKFTVDANQVTHKAYLYYCF